jgi:hypothetical protein
MILVNLFKKSLCATLLLCLFSVQYATHIGAVQDDFVHSVNAIYTLTQDKKTRASYEITTTNQVGNNYLQTFTFNLPFEISNISVSDSQTPISVKEFKKSESGNLYTLTIDIVKPVYGLNKSFNWKINFEIQNILIPHGMQNAIVIPNFNEDSKISDYVAKIEFPKSLGEVAYAYGNSQITNFEDNTVVTFKNSVVKNSTFMILLGDKQEYFFETTVNAQDIPFKLPEQNETQDIFYTNFPERSLGVGDKIDSGSLDLKAGESLKGFILTKKGYDRNYQNTFQNIANPDLISNLNSDLQNNRDKAQDIFYQIISKYTLSNFITTPSTTVELSNNKTELNPAELNEIYRQVLTKLGIENRGVYGYVFPIQPFVREEFKTDLHIWSEFWDGEKWVVVDPTWFITSKGNDYFDKNSYHHIKFGNYRSISELKSFLNSAQYLKITPLQNQSYFSKDINIVMQGYSDTQANKNFRLEFVNKSNQPVYLDTLTANLNNIDAVKIIKDKTKFDTAIFPNSKLTVDIPLDYGMLWKDKSGTINLSLDYKDQNNTQSTIKFSHAINVRSNISSYISEFLIGVILLFLLITIGSFVLYKKF